MNITKFFLTNYIDYGAYDNIRKIASVIDGMKYLCLNVYKLSWIIILILLLKFLS